MAPSGGGRLSEAVCLYGTDEPLPASETFTVGPLSFTLSGHALRYLRWRGHEVLRGIDFLVRDRNWGTYAPTPELRGREAEDGRLRLTFTASVAEGALDYRLLLEADAEGALDCTVLAVPRRDFPTNRTGFVVLHPIAGVAGAEAEIRHPDGRVAHGRFPERIAPAQPFLEIAGIRHRTAAGVEVDCRLEGDVFEMEDQRNWSDASFKTYNRPLSLPFPYVLRAGEPVTQRVSVRIAGDVPATSEGGAAAVSLGGETGEAMPALALAFEPGWEPPAAGIAALRRLEVGSLLARADVRRPSDLAAALAAARDLALPLELELVVADEGDPGPALLGVADALRRAGLRPASVTALPAAYLRSHQPQGPWPRGASPEEARDAARRAFPGIPVGSGMFTNFTEFNRRPPRPPFAFATHANAAIVHAADDLSVMETLECLPHIFASARALIGDAGYRGGLFAIGMRGNPYGAGVADNPEQRRLPMAGVDPRQRGLFGAAYAIGVLAATAGFGLDRIALAAPAGPFGCLYRPARYPQPGYDGLADPDGVTPFPLYHALRLLAGAAGRPRLSVGVGDPSRLAALAWRGEEGAVLCLANLGAGELELRLPGRPRALRLLDRGSVKAATLDPDWSAGRDPPPAGGNLRLGAYAVARLEMTPP